MPLPDSRREVRTHASGWAPAGRKLGKGWSNENFSSPLIRKSYLIKRKLWNHFLGRRSTFKIKMLCVKWLRLFKRFYLFLETGEREKKRGRETSVCGCLSCVPYRGPGLQPGIHPDWELNQHPLVLRLALSPLSHTSQGLNIQIFELNKEVLVTGWLTEVKVLHEVRRNRTWLWI